MKFDILHSNSVFSKILRAIIRRIYFTKEKYILKPYLQLFENKIGLEIGGPSRIFSNNGEFPIYPIAKKIDGCNFSTNTVWEGNITNDIYSYRNLTLGNQFIYDITNNNCIIETKYDFIISSNCLEHIANPLKAIGNIINMLNNKGIIVLIVPDKSINFDHNREYTSFDHLLDDFKRNIGNNDLTHYNEIIKLHDLKLDPLAGSFDNFKNRSLDNYVNRCLHHHVFSIENLNKITIHFDLEIILLHRNIINITLVARKKI